MDRVEFVALIAYTVYLFGTGAVIVMLAGVRRNFTEISYGISISLLVITQLLARSLGSTLANWWLLLHILVLIFVVSALAIRYLDGSKRVTSANNLDFKNSWVGSCHSAFCCLSLVSRPLHGSSIRFLEPSWVGKRAIINY